MALLKLIRWPNLLIITLTQYLFYWLIVDFFHSFRISTILDFTHFTMLILTTLIIAAGGYIINDIMDFDIDQINKPERMIIGQYYSIAQAKLLYGVLLIFGAFIAVYLAFHIQKPGLFLIYPFAVFLMWLYSKSLKQQALSGNIVVALFSALVPGIVWFAEREGFWELPPTIGKQMSGLFIFYMVFAFFSTLFREIVKDMEDFEGDQKNNCQTLPILIGIKHSKMITLVIGLFLLFTIVYWIHFHWLEQTDTLFLINVMLLIVPTIFVLWKFYRSKHKKDFYWVSQYTKLLMLSGLLYLWLFFIYH